MNAPDSSRTNSNTDLRALLLKTFPPPRWEMKAWREADGAVHVFRAALWAYDLDKMEPPVVEVRGYGSTKREAKLKCLGVWNAAVMTPAPVDDGRTYFDASAEEAARLREAFDIGQKALEAAVNEAVSHREHLAAVEPVVRAAVKLRNDERDEAENDSAAVVMATVDALPEALRKEYGA